MCLPPRCPGARRPSRPRCPARPCVACHPAEHRQDPALTHRERLVSEREGESVRTQPGHTERD